MVGRHREAEAVDSQLHAPGRLATVVGPPGVGKSRLSIHVARLWRAIGNTAAYGDLTGRGSVEDLIDVTARALGVAVDSAGDVATAVAGVESALLGRGELLLLLDNADELLPEAIAALESWLEVADELRVLVTARGKLHSRRERLVELEPLPVDDAIELFVMRAQRVRPEFEADEDARRVLRHIVQRLDRLPLAIELAAARIQVMSLTTMWDRLESALTVSGPGIDPEHAVSDAIHASMSWLDEGARAGLLQTAIFAGGFELEAAEEIITLPGDARVVDVLATLRDRSLLVGTRHGSSMRFEVMRLISGFCRKRLELSEHWEGLTKRFIQHYARRGRALLAGAYGPGSEEAVRALAAERGNLEAAAELAVANHPTAAATMLLALEPLSGLGRVGDAHIDLLARVAQQLAGVDGAEEHRARVLLAHARATHRRGRLAEAAASIERAHALVEAADALRAEILAERGVLANKEGRRVEALGDLEAAVAIARTAGDSRIQGLANGLLVQRRLNDGDDRAAIDHGAQALLCHERAGDPSSAALASAMLGRAYGQSGDPDQAATLLQHALDRFHTLGDAGGLALCRMELGSVAIERGDGDRGSSLVRAALATWRQLGRMDMCGQCHQRLALRSLDLGDAAEAEKHLHEAIDAHRGVSPRGMALDMAWLAMVDVARGRYGLAEHRLSDAIDDLRALGVLGDADAFEVMLGALMLRAGKYDEATTRLRAAPSLKRPSTRNEVRALWSVVGPAAGIEVAESPRGDAEVATVRTRFAMQVLASATPTSPGDPADTDGMVLEVERKGRWFRLAEEDQVDLSSRSPGRRVLLALATLRGESPGEALDTNGIFSAGWPGERAIEAAARNRVYVTIRRLRGAGLGEALVSTDAGYLISTDVRISWVGEG